MLHDKQFGLLQSIQTWSVVCPVEENSWYPAWQIPQELVEVQETQFVKPEHATQDPLVELNVVPFAQVWQTLFEEHPKQFRIGQARQIPFAPVKLCWQLLQKFATWQVEQPVILHKIHVPVVFNVKVATHVKHVLGLVQNWQFDGQNIVAWQIPVDEIPHGAKQKLQDVLFIAQ